jgi:hypothetical protein
MNQEEGILERFWFGLGHALNDPLDWWRTADWFKRIVTLATILYCASLLWGCKVGAERAEVEQQTECRQLSAAIDELDTGWRTYEARARLMEEWRLKCDGR